MIVQETNEAQTLLYAPLDKLESIIQQSLSKDVVSKPFGIFPLCHRLKRQ